MKARGWSSMMYANMALKQADCDIDDETGAALQLLRGLHGGAFPVEGRLKCAGR